MTNVILSIIGVILAATATLITVDYGGDYYVDSQNAADATLLQNAGANIQAAYDLYEQRHGSRPGNVTALVSATGYRSFMTALPFIRGNGTINPNWVNAVLGAGTYHMLVIEGVPTSVCRMVNKRVNNFANPDVIPSAAAFREGCVNNVAGQPVANNTYYRHMRYP